MACANCGQELVQLRVDVQQARHREVVLTWLLCPSCHHVALADWSWRERRGQAATRDKDGEDGAPDDSEAATAQ